MVALRDSSPGAQRLRRCASELDPLSPMLAWQLAYAGRIAGRVDGALTTIRATIDPDSLRSAGHAGPSEDEVVDVDGSGRQRRPERGPAHRVDVP